MCVVVLYSSTEGDSDRVINRVGNGYRLCVLGDLNEGVV